MPLAQGRERAGGGEEGDSPPSLALSRSPELKERLSLSFQSKGKVPAGVESSESVPFIQIRTSPFYDITKALKESALSGGKWGP